MWRRWTRVIIAHRAFVGQRLLCYQKCNPLCHADELRPITRHRRCDVLQEGEARSSLIIPSLPPRSPPLPPPLMQAWPAARPPPQPPPSPAAWPRRRPTLSSQRWPSGPSCLTPYSLSTALRAPLCWRPSYAASRNLPCQRQHHTRPSTGIGSANSVCFAQTWLLSVGAVT